jgi:hypothetical protein
MLRYEQRSGMFENSLVLARLPIQSGVVLGILPLPVHFLLPLELSHQLAAITLVIIAGVYLGYAFKDGRARIILTELLGVLGFAAGAWFGINGYPLVILLALTLHGCWDFLHNSVINTDMPRWYIPFCAVFDWIMAGSLFVVWKVGV